MTPQQISLVRRTYAPIAANAARAGAFFYERLFALDPSLRPMFPEDLQQQGEKFVETLGVMFNALEQGENVRGDFEDLGQRHQEYGVKAHHYETMREALLWALAQILCDQFTDEVASAWTSAYNHGARIMRRGAQFTIVAGDEQPVRSNAIIES